MNLQPPHCCLGNRSMPLAFRGLLACWLLLTAPAMAAQPKLTTEEFMVPAADAGISLYVRNKHPAGLVAVGSEKILLYVHGATYPSETAFDLR